MHASQIYINKLQRGISLAGAHYTKITTPLLKSQLQHNRRSALSEYYRNIIEQVYFKTGVQNSKNATQLWRECVEALTEAKLLIIIIITVGTCELLSMTQCLLAIKLTVTEHECGRNKKTHIMTFISYG